MSQAQLQHVRRDSVGLAASESSHLALLRSAPLIHVTAYPQQQYMIAREQAPGIALGATSSRQTQQS